MDSMVLLHALHALASKKNWPIFVAHFNHRLRGRASNADEKLVRQTAKKLGLRFFGGGADVKAFAKQSKLSIEMAARKLRHEFLARTAQAGKIKTIALAHHADDQVELFFLRLLRGSGGEGLSGMKMCSPSPAAKRIFLARPLLGFTKAELLAFAVENKVRFRDDATNFSADFLRNRIRHELLPLLRKHYQPAVDRTVLRLAEIIRAEAELAGCLARQPDRKHFAACPLALQRRILQNGLSAAGMPADFELVENLRANPEKFFSIGPELSVRRDAEGRIELRRTTPVEFNPLAKKFPVRGRAGQIRFGRRDFAWKLRRAVGRSAFASGGLEIFDADKIGDEITLRHWRPGDRFQPIGMKSAVKLQDLFVNAKIPAPRRRGLVLAVTADGEIFWVEGLRIGEKARLTAQTRREFVWKHPKIAG